MRSHIEIDDDMLDAAVRAEPFKTKKDAVESGLKLPARQAACREILKRQGKLRRHDHGEGDSLALPAGVAAAHYHCAQPRRTAAPQNRSLRAIGTTLRSAIDVRVAALCMEHGYALLHRDRDFDAFEGHPGLRSGPP